MLAKKIYVSFFSVCVCMCAENEIQADTKMMRASFFFRHAEK